MGCYGMRCALSGLPEGYSRTGLLFLYADHGHKQGSPTIVEEHTYRVFLPPLWGKYDDYGKVEVAEDALSSWASGYLRKTGAIHHDLIYLQSQLQDEVVRVRTALATYDLHYALVREDVWDTLVTSAKEAVVQGKTIYPFPKAESLEDLDQALQSAVEVMRNDPLPYMPEVDSLAFRFQRLLKQYKIGGTVPRAYLDATHEMEDPTLITRPVMDTFMVIMELERQGISLSPGMMGDQLPNTRARKAFFERMVRLCDDDLADNGWGPHA